MKKIISSLSAAMIAATTLSAMSVSAKKPAELNELSVSTEVLAESITVDDTVIPAGAVAITVSISNNSGFSAYSTRLELGSAYDIIVDEDDYPIVESGAVIGDSIIGSAYNDNVAVVSTASAEESYGNGEMFTIYATGDDSSINSSIYVCEDTTAVCSTMYKIGDNDYYKVGDVDDDFYIMATDASDVLAAIKLTGSDRVYYDSVKSAPDLYFPKIADIRAAFIWNASTDPESAMLPITEATASEILKFYSCAATDKPYTGDSYLGQIRACTSAK